MFARSNKSNLFVETNLYVKQGGHERLSLQSHLVSAAVRSVLMTMQGGCALSASWKQSGDNGLERITKQVRKQNKK